MHPSRAVGRVSTEKIAPKKKKQKRQSDDEGSFEQEAWLAIENRTNPPGSAPQQTLSPSTRSRFCTFFACRTPDGALRYCVRVVLAPPARPRLQWASLLGAFALELTRARTLTSCSACRTRSSRTSPALSWAGASKLAKTVARTPPALAQSVHVDVDPAQGQPHQE